MSNQKQMVEKFLVERGSITGKQSMDELGVYRLSDVILKLRKKGLVIHTQMINVSNRYGTTSRIAKYIFLGYEIHTGGNVSTLNG